MLESARAYMGLQFAKFQFRNEIDHVQTLTQFFNGARNILLLLPVAYDNAAMASDAVSAILKNREDIHLTVVSSGTRETSLSTFLHSRVIRTGPADLNRFFLPKKTLLQHVLDRSYDVAVDLNLDFVLLTAYICKASHAPVRVGCVHQTADTFFNVQLKFDASQASQIIFKQFASRLAMF